MTLKNKIKGLLETNDIAAAAACLLEDRKALSQFVRFSYAKDTLVGWRAILAVGKAARQLVLTDPAFLRETCRKLLWSLSDESGGIGWSAPELLGEIVSAEPKQFRDVIPLIATVFDIEEKVFRPGVVYALRRIAESDPEPVYEHQRVIISALADPHPLVRILGLQLAGLLLADAGRTGSWSPEYCAKVRRAVSQLAGDGGEAWVYQGDGFVSLVVGEIASRLMKIK